MAGNKIKRQFSKAAAAKEATSFKMRLGEIICFPAPDVVALNPHIRSVLDARKIPSPIQFHLGDIGTYLEGAMTNYQKQRMKLFQTHGEEVFVEHPTNDGAPPSRVPTGKYSIKGEDNIKAFTDAHMELLQTVITVPYRPIKRSELGLEIEGTVPADFTACRAFILPPDEPALHAVK